MSEQQWFLVVAALLDCNQRTAERAVAGGKIHSRIMRRKYAAILERRTEVEAAFSALEAVVSKLQVAA